MKPQRLLAIDPGNLKSGYVIFDGKCVTESGVVPNKTMLAHVSMWFDALAVEYIAGMGMAVGQEVFDTCVFVGRVLQEYERGNEESPLLIKRRDVKLHLCGQARAKDKNIRIALCDKFGGEAVAKGRKATPGPLYGVSSHAWSALAVAVTAWETHPW